MTSILLQPGATMVDGVGLTSLPNHAVVKAAGYAAESLYVANRYGTNRAAIERAWAAGLPVMLNYEGIDDDAKNGYPAGERAAKNAIVEAKKLGFNGDCPLPFSAADKHFTDLHGAGLDYHRALVDVFTPIGWKGGAYGFKEMLELLAQQGWWPDDWPLWHWGGDGRTHYPWAWVTQGPGGSYWNETIGRQVDHNLLLKPMRLWSGDGADHLEPNVDPVPVPFPPAPPGGADVPTILQCSDAYAAFISPSGPSVHSDVSWIDGATKALYQGAGIQVQTVSVAQLKPCVLHGPLPVGDSRQWTVEDFRLVLNGQPGQPGPKGDKGDPGPAPRSATFTY